MGTEFEVFGGARLVRDGEAVALSKQLTALLGVLLAADRRPVPTEVVVERLWADDARPASASKIVHIGVSKLRRAIGAAEVGAGDPLRTEADGYVLDAEPADLRRWAEAVTEARRVRSQDPAAALRAAAAAVAAWTARPWGRQADEPWLASQVEALEGRRRDAEELHTELLLEVGPPAAAVEALEVAVRREPLRERRWEQLMLGLYRAGRQADALRAYQRARALLRSELGIEPGPGLRRLELAVLQQDPGLEAGASRPADVHAATSFVGREAELAELGRVLRRQRLVTVTGIGGIGKSRLVREFAHRSWPEAETRIVPLGALEHPAGLVPHVARELGVVLEAATADATAIAVALRGRIGLLVVDGAENLLDDVTTLVLELLERCRGLRIVVTSRVPLGIGDEWQIGLAPLPAASATGDLGGTDLALMIDRAGYDVAALDDASLASLRDACHGAGGIPMLVELAARTLELAGPSGAASPTGGDRDPLALVHAAIGNSLEAVDDATAELVTRASVLPGGVTETVAAGLTGADTREVRRSLRQLAWLHLVEATTARTSLRYRSLDPIRHALLERLGAEAGATTARAATVLLRLAESVRPDLGGAVDLVALDRVEDEHENLRFVFADRLAHDPALALDLAIASAEYFGARGFGPEAHDWLDLAIAAARPTGPAAWRAELAYARATRTLAEVAARRSALEAAVAEARTGDDRLLAGSLVLYTAIARGWSGDRAGALEAIREATELTEDIADPWMAANVDHLRALDAALGGDFAAAREGQRVFAARMLELGDSLGAGTGYYLAAALGDMAGETDGLAEIEAARALATETRDVSLLGRLLMLEARLLRRTGDPRSTGLLRRAAGELEQLGGLRAAALARRDLGLVLVDAGDPDAAVPELTRAAEVLAQLDPPAARPAFAGLAAIARGCGATALAEALAARARVEPGGTPPLIAEDAAVVERLLAGFAPRAVPPETSDEDLLVAAAGLARRPEE